MPNILLIDDEAMWWDLLRDLLPDFTVYWCDRISQFANNEKMFPKLKLVVCDYGGVAGKPFEELKRVRHQKILMTSAEELQYCPYPFVLKKDLVPTIYRMAK